jgi:hypothetical protein
MQLAREHARVRDDCSDQVKAFLCGSLAAVINPPPFHLGSVAFRPAKAARKPPEPMTRRETATHTMRGSILDCVGRRLPNAGATPPCSRKPRGVLDCGRKRRAAFARAKLSFAREDPGGKALSRFACHRSPRHFAKLRQLRPSPSVFDCADSAAATALSPAWNGDKWSRTLTANSARSRFILPARGAPLSTSRGVVRRRR